MNTNIKTARVVGALFITATVAAIISGAFLLPILEAPDYLAEVSANENQVMMGALFYFGMAAAGASIAIPMYPILKKHHEGLALGAVGFRLIEGAIFMVGVFCVLLLVKVSEGFVQAGAPDDSHFQTLGELLLAGYTIDQAVVPAVFAFSPRGSDVLLDILSIKTRSSMAIGLGPYWSHIGDSEWVVRHVRRYSQ